MSLFIGAATALVTPFREDEINYDSLDFLINWQIKKGIDALVITGTTGESATLSIREHKQIIKHSINKIDKRVPVIIGTGSNNTMHCLEMSKYAEEQGADALLIVTPYYNKTTQVGVIRHYQYIADRVNIPIIIYNVPSRTGFNISEESVYELSKHKNIKGLKEASGKISYVAKIASMVDDSFYIYSGNDDCIVPVLSLGGRGVISVVSNAMPYEIHMIVRNYIDNKVDESKKMQLKLLDFISKLFIETNPIPIKECLNYMGFDVGGLRMPLCKMSTNGKIKLLNSMKKIGLGKI